MKPGAVKSAKWMLAITLITRTIRCRTSCSVMARLGDFEQALRPPQARHCLAPCWARQRAA